MRTHTERSGPTELADSPEQQFPFLAESRFGNRVVEQFIGKRSRTGSTGAVLYSLGWV